MAVEAPLSKSKLNINIPAGIWALGFVSMFMDVSSEMIHALLPIYLVTVLGASTLSIGFIEGIAEATANVTKIFSGALSDWLGNRKLLTALGYGLAAFTKPIFPLATTIGWVIAARFIDRIGKGVRGAPRDALVADLAPANLHGASFGLRNALCRPARISNDRPNLLDNVPARATFSNGLVRVEVAACWRRSREESDTSPLVGHRSSY